MRSDSIQTRRPILRLDQRSDGSVTLRNIVFVASLFCGVVLATQSGHVQTIPAQTNPAQPNPVQTTPAPANPSSVLPPAGDPVGNVATLTGTATISRFGNSTPLKTNDDVYLGDTLQTGANSALSVTFTDDTTFKLSASARIVVNKYLYEEGGQKNSALFNVARGTVAFVASAVARTGDMKIATPTATLGIRGTTGVIDVPENASATGGGNEVAIKLYPDQDGRVGHIEVNGRDGARLGLLSQASSGFSIRPAGAGGRFTAAPLQISPQVAARDLGYVRQVHAAQGIGRQIVSQQRTLRLQNPSRQGGQPRGPGGAQPLNGTGPARQQPGTPRQPPGQPLKQQRQPDGAAKKSEQRPNDAARPPATRPSGMQRAPGMPGGLQPRTPRQPGLLPRMPKGLPKPQKAPKHAR